LNPATDQDFETFRKRNRNQDRRKRYREKERKTTHENPNFSQNYNGRSRFYETR
jgi:hypothetical protein